MENDLSWMRMPSGYRARYVPCPGGYYWHLYCRGTRINGGLAADSWDAQMTAQRYAGMHSYGDDGPADLDVDLAMRQSELRNSVVASLER